MSGNVIVDIKNPDDAPKGAFVIGTQQRSEAEYRFHITTQLHNHPFPGTDTEEFYRQGSPAARNFEAETHSPTFHTQLVLNALGDVKIPPFDYTKGVRIGKSEQTPFSSFVQVHLNNSDVKLQSLDRKRMKKLFAKALNPQKLTYVVSLSV